MGMNKLLTILICTLTIGLANANRVEAAPPWDLDYELYVAWDMNVYSIYINPAGNGNSDTYRYSYYSTNYDASYYLFKLVEWGIIQPGDDAWIVEETIMSSWQHLDTYETYTEAQSAAQLLESAGLHTDIRSVFGGYTNYPITWFYPIYSPSSGYRIGN